MSGNQNNHADLNFNIAIQTNDHRNQSVKYEEKKIDEPQIEKLQENNQESNKSQSITSFMTTSSHPFICLFTFFFKILSLVFFLLSSIFPTESVSYLVIILSSAFDFWMVKNISGRKLVSLRWWNELSEDGTEKWVFESGDENRNSQVDKSVFWFNIWVNSGIWVFYTFYELITLKIVWFVIAFICMTFNLVNLFGYFKCSKEQQNMVKGLAKKQVVNVIDKKIEAARK